MKCIILIAAPAAGKGTISKYIEDKYNYKHISTGDLLRKEIKNNTEIGKEIKSILDKGSLVGDDIIKEVFGKEFDDPEWIAANSFGSEEWDILKGVIDDLYPDEELAFEMAYSLLDIENQSNSLGKRKGVVEALEACIKRNYYKDEEDATKFYLQQMYRKKEMGGKYNAKAIDDTYDEIDEEEEDEE